MQRTTPIRVDQDIETIGHIQCVTCGKLIGHMYDTADDMRRRNYTEKEIYEELGLQRTCCRFHLTRGFKLAMAPYLDETVRLDIEIEESEQTPTRTGTGTGTGTGKVTQELSENMDRIVALRSRLNKMTSESGKYEQMKRISYFVAT